MAATHTKTAPKSWIKWLLLILVIKAAFFIFFTVQFQHNYPPEFIESTIFMAEGETPTYYFPVENLLQGKGYSYEHQYLGQEVPSLQPTARRMPGIAPFYGPLLLLFDQSTARAFMIIIQFLLSCLSVYALALIARMLFNSTLAFLLTLFAYTISTYVSIYDHFGLAESLSTTFIIFSVYCFLRAMETEQRATKWWLLAGLFAVWTVFMRPATGMIIPVLGLVWLWHWRKEGSKKLARLIVPMLFFALPIALSISTWAVRNYVSIGTVTPLEDNIYTSLPHIYPSHLKPTRKLIAAWGAKTKRFQVGSVGEWFFNSTDLDDPNPDFKFPDYIFTSAYSRDSLVALRRQFHLGKDTDQQLSPSERDYYRQMVIEKAVAYRQSFQSEHPMQFYVLSPIRSVANFIFNKTENKLPFPAREQMGLHQLLIKAGYIVYYNLLVVLALVGMVVIWIAPGRHKHKLLLLFPLLYVIVLGGVLFNTERRYLVSVYPFWVLYAVPTILLTLRWLGGKIDLLGNWMDRLETWGGR